MGFYSATLIYPTCVCWIRITWLLYVKHLLFWLSSWYSETTVLQCSLPLSDKCFCWSRDSSCVVLKEMKFVFFQCSLFIVDYLGNEALHPVMQLCLFSFGSLFLHHWPFSVLGWRVRWFCWICWHVLVRPHVLWHVPFGAWLSSVISLWGVASGHFVKCHVF